MTYNLPTCSPRYCWSNSSYNFRRGITHMLLLRAWVASIGLVFLGGAILHADGFVLQEGDHICIISNTLAERMQHSGWLKTLLRHRFTKHQLVIRDLGYSGGEIGGYTD